MVVKRESRAGKLVLAQFLLIIMLFASALCANAASLGKVKLTKAYTSNGSIILNWEKVSGAIGYNIYVSQPDGSYQKMGTAAKSAKSYKISGLYGGYSYTIYVRAYNGDEEGPISKKVTLTPSRGTGLVAPTNLSVVNNYQKVTVTWDAVTNISGYALYQEKNGKWKKIATTKSKSYTVKNLTNYKEYKFKVCTFRTSGGKTTYGPFSKVIIGRPFYKNAKKVGLSNVHSFYYKARMNVSYTAKTSDGSSSHSFSAGQSVTVVDRGTNRHLVQYKKKDYVVPASYITLTGFITDSKNKYSGDVAELYVNWKGYSSPSKYLIWINAYSQYLYLFEGSQYNWKLKFMTICATGMFGIDEEGRRTATPIGITRIRGKVYDWWFASNQVAYWASTIAGGAIHSWLYYPGGGKWAGVGQLGVPSSHGCVRIDIEKSKYIYDNIPVGTTVVVW